MKRAIPLIAAFLLLLAAVPSSAEVLRVIIDGPIHPIADEYIGRALAQAEQQHADAVLIELRTPGGLVDSTRKIVEKILKSPVPVIVYVAPSGSNAASAGFYILEAADIAAMAPGTNTGAAHPVTIGGDNKKDDIMMSKVENDSAAFLRSYVSKRGRNVQVAETAVRESKSFTDQEALDQKLIDVVAANQQELLNKLNGRKITRFDGNTATLHLGNENIVDVNMSLKQRILGFLMDPNIAFIVLAIGALALYAEFNHPGAVIPGVVGIVFIILALFALNLLPVRYAALTLILASFVLFALEAKFGTHGALGIGGVVLLTLGGLLLVDGPIPEMRVRLWTALGVSIPFGLITVFLMTIAIRAHKNKVVTGVQGLVGELGVARTTIAPQGKVFVHGELWDAYSTKPIEAGEQVVIRKVDGLHLQVEPVRAAQPVLTTT